MPAQPQQHPGKSSPASVDNVLPARTEPPLRKKTELTGEIAIQLSPNIAQLFSDFTSHQNISLTLCLRFLMEERRLCGSASGWMAWFEEVTQAARPVAVTQELMTGITTDYYRQFAELALMDVGASQHNPAYYMLKPGPGEQGIRQVIKYVNPEGLALRKLVASQDYHSLIASLAPAEGKRADNRYLLLLSQQHVMAIALKQDINGRYLWSFFDPLKGSIYNFDSHAVLVKFIGSYLHASNAPAPTVDNEPAISPSLTQGIVISTIEFTEQVPAEPDIRLPAGFWKTARDNERAYIISALRQPGIDLLKMSPALTILQISAQLTGYQITGTREILYVSIQDEKKRTLRQLQIINTGIPDFQLIAEAIARQLSPELLTYAPELAEIEVSEDTDSLPQRIAAETARQIPPELLNNAPAVITINVSENLPARTERVLRLVDDLHQGLLLPEKLNNLQQHLLADFFPLQNGHLDIMSIRNIQQSEHAWRRIRYSLQALLRLERTDKHYWNTLSGVEALQKMHDWYTRLNAGREALQQAIMQAHNDQLPITVYFTEQFLYPDTAGMAARRGGRNIGLAWLYSKAKNPALGDLFLLTLNTCTHMMEQNVDSSLSVEEKHLLNQFDTALHTLVDEPHAFHQQPPTLKEYPLDNWLSQLPDEDNQHYYYLTAGWHTLLLTKHRSIASGKWIYELYDPQLGKIHIAHHNQSVIINALSTTLNTYLKYTHPAFDQHSLAWYYHIPEAPDGQFLFSIAHLDLSNTTSPPVVEKLWKLLQANVASVQQWIQKNSSSGITPFSAGSVTDDNPVFPDMTSVNDSTALPLDQWTKPVVQSFLQTNTHESNYDFTIVFQIENDPVVLTAVGNLAGKHPDRTTVIQYNTRDGQSRVVHGDPVITTQATRVRWVIAAHGRTFKKQQPAQLYADLVTLAKNQGLSLPQRIVLLGCSLASSNTQQPDNFAFHFINAMKVSGSEASLRAYSEEVMISLSGRRLTRTGGHRQWLFKEGKHRVDYHWNDQGNLLINGKNIEQPAQQITPLFSVHAAQNTMNMKPLTERARDTLSLVQQLVAGDSKLHQLTNVQLSLLNDFFPTQQGTPDFRLLVDTIIQPQHYRRINSRLQDLLVRSHLYPQLEQFDGYEALQRLHNWDTRRQAALAALYRKGTDVSTQIQQKIYILSQGLYLADSSSAASAGARNLGLAWLDALHRGENVRERLLNALQIHEQINRQTQTSEHAITNLQTARQFLTLLDNLEQEENIIDPFNHHGQQRLNDWLSGLADNVDDDPMAQGRQHHQRQLQLTQGKNNGYYWLQSGKLQLMLATRYSGVRWQYDLYDPLMGWEVRFSGYDQHKIIKEIGNTLRTYLNSTHVVWKNHTMASDYGVLQQNGQFVFTIRELDPVKLAVTPALNELNDFLDSDVISKVAQQEIAQDNQSLLTFHSDVQDSVAIVAEQNLPVLRSLPVLPLPKQGKRPLSNQNFTLPAGNQHGLAKNTLMLNRIAGYTGIFTHGMGILQSLSALSNYRRRLASSNLTPDDRKQLETEIIIVSSALLYEFLSEGSACGFSTLAMYLARKNRVNASYNLMRFGSPLLNIAGTGFDIYGAWQAFSALENEKNPLRRQDLTVSAIFSLLGIVVSTGSSGAMMSGGALAAYGGPAGIALSTLLFLGSGIYSGVRMVEEIKKQVALTPLQELNTGWRGFWGWEPHAEIQNALNKDSVRKQVRQELDRQLAIRGQRILQKNEGDIATIYYSLSDFSLQEYSYKQLLILRSAFPENNAPVILDKILPDKAKKIGVNFPGVQRYMMDSDYKFYTPESLHSVDDRLDLVTPENNSSTVASQHYQPQETLTRSSVQSRVLFLLGGGDDTVRGDAHHQNIFVVQSGRKTFLGGLQTDHFLLAGEKAPYSSGRLDGSDGQDWIIASEEPADGRGYELNLQAGFVGYRRYLSHDSNETVIATVHDIEHAMGHARTDDRLTGNEENNQLNGAGGRDIIYGLGGDDILTLAAGSADGGTGTDSYHILQNHRDSDVSVTLTEADSLQELSWLLLDYDARQISAVS